MSTPAILVINGGSSSIKFAVFENLESRLSGAIARIGLPGTELRFKHAGALTGNAAIPVAQNRSEIHFLIDWLSIQPEFENVLAVGHRVVHGMEHAGPAPVTQELIYELHRLSPYDPDHMPREIELIEIFRQRFPRLPHIACFDTSFHHGLPRVAKLLPLPRLYEKKGVRRYGFHGLSYAFVLEELARVAGPQAARGKLVLAHLGNGASLAAVREGASIDVSMGFTPAGGIPMGTRSGDLDPGVVWYLLWSENMTPKKFSLMINHDSGLLGISGSSSDMRDLLERQARDQHAAEAVELFCYSARKCIGAFAAALEGLDMVVFTGGIGQNAPEIRARICSGLGFLGLELAGERNDENADLISADTSRVAVRVVRTDEQSMIAQSVMRYFEEQRIFQEAGP